MSEQLGLFGELPVEAAPVKRPRRMKDRAHAATPGTGPDGETCGSCEHYTRVRSGAGNVFRKCGLMRSTWTRGPGTDIRARDAACGRWEASAS